MFSPSSSPEIFIAFNDAASRYPSSLYPGLESIGGSLEMRLGAFSDSLLSSVDVCDTLGIFPPSEFASSPSRGGLAVLRSWCVEMSSFRSSAQAECSLRCSCSAPVQSFVVRLRIPPHSTRKCTRAQAHNLFLWQRAYILLCVTHTHTHRLHTTQKSPEAAIMCMCVHVCVCVRARVRVRVCDIYLHSRQSDDQQSHPATFEPSQSAIHLENVPTGAG